MYSNKKFSKTLNIRSEYGKEEEKDDQVQLQICSNNVNVSFHRLFKYCQVIQEEYKNQHFQKFINYKIELYQQQYQIKKENFDFFFQIINEEEVKIMSSQYCDLCKLNDIFKVKPLENLLKKYLQEHLNDIEFLIQLTLENEKNHSFFEKNEIHIELENCLKNNI